MSVGRAVYSNANVDTSTFKGTLSLEQYYGVLEGTKTYEVKIITSGKVDFSTIRKLTFECSRDKSLHVACRVKSNVVYSNLSALLASNRSIISSILPGIITVETAKQFYHSFFTNIVKIPNYQTKQAILIELEVERPNPSILDAHHRTLEDHVRTYLSQVSPRRKTLPYEQTFVDISPATSKPSSRKASSSDLKESGEKRSADEAQLDQEERELTTEREGDYSLA